jgi:hypothetical protein
VSSPTQTTSRKQVNCNCVHNDSQQNNSVSEIKETNKYDSKDHTVGTSNPRSMVNSQNANRAENTDRVCIAISDSDEESEAIALKSGSLKRVRVLSKKKKASTKTPNTSGKKLSKYQRNIF